MAVPTPVPPRAAYIHIPFCVSKCHYCDFNSYPGMESIFADYVDALVTEIAGTAAPPVPLDSLYFGGGTPTVLPAASLASLVHAVKSHIGLAEDAEVTVEANPATVDRDKLVQLGGQSFNRLSLGVQSFDDDLLRKIGRVHSTAEAVQAYNDARAAGFANVGIDLIFALPGQTLEHWENTLRQAIGLGPQHISLYELSIEEGTEFARMCAEGTLELPGEDDQIAMYELAIGALTAAGFEHYEVSNFALPGYRSRQNQAYWRNDPYYGFGAGATSYVGGVRARRVSDPRAYISAVRSGGEILESAESLAGSALLAETVIQGLRMLEGIGMDRFRQRTGTDLAVEFGPQIERLTTAGLLEVCDGRLMVTHRGLLLLNDVSSEFLP